MTPAPPTPAFSGGPTTTPGILRGVGETSAFPFYFIFKVFFFLKLFPHLTNNVFFNFMAAPVAYGNSLGQGLNLRHSCDRWQHGILFF